MCNHGSDEAHDARNVLIPMSAQHANTAGLSSAQAVIYGETVAAVQLQMTKNVLQFAQEVERRRERKRSNPQVPEFLNGSLPQKSKYIKKKYLPARPAYAGFLSDSELQKKDVWLSGNE